MATMLAARHLSPDRRERGAERLALAGAFIIALCSASPAAQPARSSTASRRTASSAAAASRGPASSASRPTGAGPSGLYLDLCRAIGAALLGPDGRIEFRPYDSDNSFDRVRQGADDLSFLDGSEIVEQKLAGKTTPGPPVVFLSTAAMVRENSPANSLADLAGRAVCFYQGSNAHRNLEAWMAARKLDFVRMGYMEYGELYDAYDAGVCEVLVGEAGDLAVGASRRQDRRRAASFPSRSKPSPSSR